MNEPVEDVVDAERRKLFDWQELWLHKELFYFFTWRDIKIKYKQTALGFLWAILQPLLMMIIFTFFFGRALNVPSQNLPYPVFVFSGLLLWNAFSSGLSNSANSMVNNAQIIKKIYFPRLIIPVSSILVALNAEQFVETLVSHANDTIIFSAAIPGQGGQNHLNEQWGSYWEALFRKQDYHRVDAIRPKVWNNEKVDVWYRQNMFLFVREGDLIHHNNSVQMAEIHPDLWKCKTDLLISLFEKTEGFEKGTRRN